MPNAIRASLPLVLLAGLPASADVSDLLDRVPESAAVMIAVPDSGEMIGGAQAFLRSVGEAEAAIAFGAASGILATPGVGNGAMVMVIPEIPEDGAEPAAVVLMEFDDFGKAATNMGAIDNDGLYEFNFMGEVVFAREVGADIAVLSPEKGSVVGFAGGDGASRAHAKRIGSIGGDLLDDSHVFISANFTSMAPMIKQGYAMGKQQMAGAMMMMGPAAAVFQDDSIDQMLDAFLRDARAGIMSITFADGAVALDFGASFEKGSEIGSYFADRGSTEGLLAKVPDGDFLYAHAIDRRSEGLYRLSQDAKAWSAKMNEMMGQGGGDGSIPDLFEEGARGEAFYLGRSPGGLLGGLLSRSVRYVRTDDPAGMMRGAEKAAGELDGFEAGPFIYSSNWESGATEVGGISAARWSVGIRPKPGDMNAQQAAMMLPMIFGPTAGPAGFAAPVDGGVVSTFSAGNTALLQEAIDAAQQPAGLGAGDRVGMARGLLPENRFLEYYINSSGVIQSGAQAAQMFMPQLPFELPGELTPIGGSASSGDGGLAVRVVIPTDVIKWAIETGQALEAQNGGGNPGGPPRF